MNLKLTRTNFLSTGIFGELESEDGKLYLFSLEHAYPIQPDGIHGAQSWAPKIPPGQYTCVRGMHQLKRMPAPFETFEVTGVEGHTGLLFHKGDVDKDSSGCILLGMLYGQDEILNSAGAFYRFMKAQEGCDSFILTVTNG